MSADRFVQCLRDQEALPWPSMRLQTALSQVWTLLPLEEFLHSNFFFVPRAGIRAAGERPASRRGRGLRRLCGSFHIQEEACLRGGGGRLQVHRGEGQERAPPPPSPYCTSCNASERSRICLAGGVINHSGILQAPEETGETSRVYRGLEGFVYKQPICGATSVSCLDLSLSLGSSVTLRFFFLQWMSATPDTTAVISSSCDFIVMSTG